MLKRTPTAAQDQRQADAPTKSLRKALALLEAVANAPHPPTIAEAAAIANVPRPTAYRLVRTLVSEGQLSSDRYGRLQVGLAVLPLAAKVLDTTRIRAEALPPLHDLARTTGERANLGVVYRNCILYIAGSEKPSLPVLHARFGRVVPMHCSALGKAVLAALPEEDVRAIIAAQPLTAYTPNTITTYLRLVEELEEVRRRGYAVGNAEYVAGLYSVAVAVMAATGRPEAAVGLTGRDLDVLVDHCDKVRHAAEVIAHRLEFAE